jgi:Arc/MetJ-type ribon-helix-helix transcriptional regulator
MQVLSIQVPDAFISGLDMLVLYGYYTNRSEAIRMALRDLFQKDMGGLQGIQNTQMLYQSVKNSKISNEEIDE